LAEAVSTPQQTLQRTTIGALADQLETEISASPALILYGPLAEGTPDDGQD
ncbi:MAG TPA: uroporphyrinogen-III C-methyltransferase, partial [Alphaproteobacteria bacterium]|nr:uroporphyrinogen-III C-methyltransferase [Alphaproteobacteria bacterium]